MNNLIRTKRFKELLDIIKNYSDKSIAIYGTGNHTNLLLNFIDAYRSKILCLLDRKINKKRLYDFDIYLLENIPKDVKVIIISSDVYQEEIYERIKFLIDKGIKIIKIYNKEDFFNDYDYYIKCNNEETKNYIESDDKLKYRELCKKERTIPIFSKDWWMDAVCGKNNWDVIIIEKSGIIVGSLPYYIKKISEFKIISQPMLTQTNGIWIKYPPNQQYYKKLFYEKKIMNEIIYKLKQLKINYFEQGFHYSIINWLPFYWNDFKQTTRYTYVIESLADLEKVFSGFSNAKIKNIKKAEKIVDINYDLSSEEFYDLHKKILQEKNDRISYPYELFKKIYDECYNHKSGKCIYAEDKNGNIHAAIFIIWDEISAYYLISAIDSSFANSGSSSLLIKSAIQYVFDKTQKFDFEGSMIESVENSFRQFNTVQKPYFFITKKFID
ncbi:hypothetical protein [Clostridium botulinum]|uniref:hypothetical protein n=1 Tax=Clostridium botulinum TaxID=1491 RepID=UPI001FD69E2E|nr:hypothetical protein [Clostridium botulinum]MCJ8172284.1 hypothetical protein [Clostridium botulinum]